MEGIPRILEVTPIGNLKLRVRFNNGQERIYDCSGLLSRDAFRRLEIPAFFRTVRVDPGGYGISWNDDLDLSEYELWTNGKTVPEKVPDKGGASR
jgi:hypothetical protein